MTTEELNEFYLMRKKAGLAIDPLTAEVFWSYAQTMDPYGTDPDLPEEYHQIGRQYFARSPESEIWVWFGDLPEETRDELWTMHNRQLAFPAGLHCRLAEPRSHRIRRGPSLDAVIYARASFAFRPRDQ